MLLTKTKLVSTAYRPGQYDPQPLCEVAVVGRSNAGKSSLINTICNNKKLARVSSAPGKTRSINFYEMDAALMLVDLPGYGFAKRSGREREDWGRLVDDYFGRSQTLGHLLLLCDIRHDVSAGDVQMAQWLQYYGIPFTLVATKADKLAKSKRPMQIQKLKKQLQAQQALGFSALEGVGKDALLAELERILAQSSHPQAQEKGE